MSIDFFLFIFDAVFKSFFRFGLSFTVRKIFKFNFDIKFSNFDIFWLISRKPKNKWESKLFLSEKPRNSTIFINFWFDFKAIYL